MFFHLSVQSVQSTHFHLIVKKPLILLQMYPVVRREPIIYRELHDRQCPIQDILSVFSVKDCTLYI